MRWNDFGHEALESEQTVWTEGAHARLYSRAQLDGPSGWEAAFAGPELRLLMTEKDSLGYRSYVVSVWGQAPSHGKQGAHPARLAELRQLEYEDGGNIPVLFLAVQGDVGWATWLVLGHEPPLVNLGLGAVPDRRVGWACADMINVGFVAEAVERRSAHPRTMWRWPERAPLANTEGALF